MVDGSIEEDQQPHHQHGVVDDGAAGMVYGMNEDQYMVKVGQHPHQPNNQLVSDGDVEVRKGSKPKNLAKPDKGRGSKKIVRKTDQPSLLDMITTAHAKLRTTTTGTNKFKLNIEVDSTKKTECDNNLPTTTPPNNNKTTDQQPTTAGAGWGVVVGCCPHRLSYMC